MHELVGDFTTLLQAALSCPVHAYQLIKPPTQLRVQVVEGEVSGENAQDLDEVPGGSSFRRLGIECYVETLWDEKTATVAALDAATVTVENTVKANRDIAAADGKNAAVGRHDGTTPYFSTYPGHPDAWVKGRVVRASWRAQTP